MKGLKKLVVLCCAAAIFAGGSLAAPQIRGGNLVSADDALTVKTANSVERVMRNADISALSDGAIAISAAKNEYEGGQFFVRSATAIDSYTVSVSDLTGTNGIIPQENITIYAEIYTNVMEKPYGGNLPTGEYPDALIPFSFIEEKGENSIPADGNQGFFVDVKVPETAAAGTYQGTVQFLSDAGNAEIPVSLTVYDFALPQDRAMQTSYLIWPDWLLDGELDNTLEKQKDYFEMLLDYNISAFITPYGFPVQGTEAFTEFLTEYYDRLSAYAFPYRSMESRYVLDTEYLEGYLEAVAQKSMEDGKNYFEKAYYYFDTMYDEPNDEKLANLVSILTAADNTESAVAERLETQFGGDAEKAELLQAVTQSLLGIKHVIPALGQSLDTYDLRQYDINPCPAYSSLRDTKSLEYFSAMTEERGVFTYGCINNDTYPLPTYQINDYLMTMRDMFWSDYEYGFTGDLYWCVNGYNNWQAYAGDRYGRLNDHFHTASHDGISNGDGYLLYPGLLYGSDQPFPSLRLVAKRDGIDDYEYMVLLEEEYAALSAEYGNADLSAREVVAFLNRSILGRNASKLDSSNLFAARETLAALIGAAKDGIAFGNIEVSDGRTEYDLYTHDGVTLTVQDAPVTAAETDTGLRFSSGTPLSENETLSFVFGGNAAATLTFKTINEQVLLNTFDAADGVETTRLSSAEISADYAKDGANSLKVTLAGAGQRYAAEVDSETYSGYEFWVYNPGEAFDVDVVFMEEIILANGQPSTQAMAYDTLTLPAGSWTKITVDNLNVFYPLNVERQAKLSELGLRVSSGAGDAERVLYIDSLYGIER